MNGASVRYATNVQSALHASKHTTAQIASHALIVTNVLIATSVRNAISMRVRAMATRATATTIAVARPARMAITGPRTTAMSCVPITAAKTATIIVTRRIGMPKVATVTMQTPPIASPVTARESRSVKAMAAAHGAMMAARQSS